MLFSSLSPGILRVLNEHQLLALAAFTGLAQIIPVTPLIIWVMIMILSVVNIGAGGVRIAKKNGLLGGTQTPRQLIQQMNNAIVPVIGG